jgi:hypothetical protein
MKVSRPWLSLTLSLASGLMLAAACEAGGGSTFGDVDDGAGTESGTGGAGGSGGETFVGSGGVFNPSGGGGMEQCAGTEAAAEPKKLHMLVVLDRSGSMSGAKWTGSIDALTSYINDPASDGTAMGLNYFPPLDLNDDECAQDTYDPPMVPIGDLPANGATLINSMNMTSTTGLTPTYGAMRGSLQVATALQDQYPDDAVIVVLASDGDPTSCDTSIPNIAALSSSAYGYNGVRTFAIAIQGSDLTDLSTIATAGGGEAFDVSTNINLFKDKLEEIRANALGCEYTIPEPMEGEEFDPLKVNVEYTPGGMGTPEDLPQADNAGDCGNMPGWYYDNPTDPTKIILCPASCDAITNDTNAQVNLIFGCPTVLN